MIEAFECASTLAAAQSVLPRHGNTPDSFQGSQLDILALAGFLTAVLTLVFYLHQPRSKVGIVAFAICLLAMTVYGFLQGAWPLGMVVGAWSGHTFWRAKSGVPITKGIRPIQQPAREQEARVRVSESRMSQMFGSSGCN